MKILIIRTLSGTVYVALILFAIFANNCIFTIIFAILCALTLYEFHILTNKQKDINVLPAVPAVAGFVLCQAVAVIFLDSIDFFFSSGKGAKSLPQTDDLLTFLSYILMIFYIGIFIAEFFNRNTNKLKNILYIFWGHLYIVLPFVTMLLIKYLNTYFLLALFVTIWVNDTFAYLFGSWLGKHRLCERISPKKSWEGVLGGCIGALLSGFVFSKFVADLSLIQWLVFSIIIVVFGTLGDLFESLIKRKTGVKDSGNIMPGHGGLLDRLDSVIFTVIPVIIYLIYTYL
jgi:phosphatidate cytidylyltransferase